MTEEKKPDEMSDFKPRGTIAFLIIFLITLIVLWGSVYKFMDW